MFFSASVALNPAVRDWLDLRFIDHFMLPAFDTHTVTLDLAAGHYVLLLPDLHTVGYLHVDETFTDLQANAELLIGHFIPHRLRTVPGKMSLALHNRTRTGVHLGVFHDPQGIMPLDIDSLPEANPFHSLTFLSGKQVITSQVFRDLFRADSLPADEGLEIKNLTLLFTDLKGSTAMYDRLGDLQAYALVKQHFVLLRRIIAACDGAIVKTIGDAVMASFAEPSSALRAALQMIESIHTINHPESLILKIGLHSGGCIAVETNYHLDYFGQTVNVAARVQGIADANEIVSTPSVINAPGCREQLSRMQVQSEQAQVKGVAGEIQIFRINFAI